MNNNLIERLKDRAHFISGVEPRERDKDDPIVNASVNKAMQFLSGTTPSLGTPSITGGTTNNPETILTLYWNVRGAGQIAGVYVNFNSNNECQVEIIDLDSNKQFRHLTFEQLLKLDIVSRFYEIVDRAKLRTQSHRWPPDMH